MSEIRILIVEDQTMLASALATLLEYEKDFQIVAMAENGLSALEILAETKIDLVLTDIEMPEMDGISLTQEISKKYPLVRTIILTTFARTGYLQRAMQAGANGYLLKDNKVDALANIIRQIYAGEIVVSPELAISNWHAKDPLTERERQILRLIEIGEPTAKIATKVNLSKGTVRNYLSEAISKLDAKNRIDAARIARKQGWL